MHPSQRRFLLGLAGVFLLIALGVPALVAARRMRQYGWDYYLTFGPGHFFFGTSTLDRVTIDGQSVRVIGDRSPDVIEQTLEVRSSASTNLIQSIDWMLGDKLSDGRTFGRGEDITGNGRADIVVREFTGGAHCCTTYRIYEISAEGILTEIARIDAENGGGFEDRDGDGFPEFILPDWTWAYELTCYACLRYPRVALKFDGTTYTPSVDLMLETEPQAPDVATWMQQAADDQVKIGNDPTSSAMRDQVWGAMLHLIYAGQAATAWALHDAAWNDAWGNKIENLAKFKSIMHKSQFWSVINELNGGTLE